MKKCPGCGNDSDVFDCLCEHCGADLTIVSPTEVPHILRPISQTPEQTCPDPQCGAGNPLGQGTCVYCGARLGTVTPSLGSVSIQATWPWGVTMVTAPLAIGREPSFSPFAVQLAGYLDISRVHGILRPMPDGSLEIEDLGSKYGTRVGDTLLKAGCFRVYTDAEIQFSQAFTLHLRFIRS